jgi:purine-binding chemotaxis protein CheW
MTRHDFALVKLFRRLLPGQDEFLLPFQVTNEIMLGNQMTFVPRAPRFLEGVINLRGTILSPQ